MTCTELEDLTVYVTRRCAAQRSTVRYSLRVHFRKTIRYLPLLLGTVAADAAPSGSRVGLPRANLVHSFRAVNEGWADIGSTRCEARTNYEAAPTRSIASTYNCGQNLAHRRFLLTVPTTPVSKCGLVHRRERRGDCAQSVNRTRRPGQSGSSLLHIPNGTKRGVCGCRRTAFRTAVRR